MKKILFSVLAVAGFYTAQAQIPTAGLVVRYPMAGNVADSSGNGYNATATSINYTTGVDGTASRAAGFDGSASRINYNFGTNVAPFQLQTYTASAWVNFAALPNTYSNIFEIGNAAYFRAAPAAGARVQIQVGHKYAGGNYSGGVPVLADFSAYQNKWSHLVVTTQVIGNLRVYKVYLNADSIGEFNSGAPTISYASTDNNLQIGNRLATSVLSLQGAMQDFCYYNRALPASEIKQLYNATACPSAVAFTSPTRDSIYSLCVGSSINLAAATTGGTNVSYQWTKSDTIIAGQSASTLTIPSALATSAGAYKVKVLADNCPLGKSLPYSFTVKVGAATPPNASAFSGLVNPCVGSSVQYVLSILSPSDYVWTWNLPNSLWSATINNNVATVIVGDTSTANFTVKYDNGCGSKTFDFGANVKPSAGLPAKPDSILAPKALCKGSNVFFELKPYSFNQTYEWSVPADWTGSAAIRGYVATLQSSGTITVVAKNGCGVSDTLKKTVTVYPYPQVPTATQVGNTLQTTANADAYIWYALDNEIIDTVIAGVTGKTYRPAVSGNYYLGVDSNGCVKQSGAIIFTSAPNGINDVKAVFIVKMYPNPATNMVTIETAATKPTINVVDMLGKQVFSQSDSKSVTKLATDTWANGVYIVTIESENQKATQRLVINR